MNYTPTVYVLDEEHLKGMWVDVGDRRIRLCKFGLDLFVKYRWKITFDNYFLHRHEKVPYRSGVRYAVVPFHRELLGLYRSDEQVWFRNGDKFDYRLCNLYTRTWTMKDKQGGLITTGILDRYDYNIAINS
jgi:hypothetical protein